MAAACFSGPTRVRHTGRGMIFLRARLEAPSPRPWPRIASEIGAMGLFGGWGGDF